MLDVVLNQDKVGSILSGGGASPATNSPQAWAEETNAVQKFALDHSRLGIPIVYGVDAVHGHNNVLGATMFPHQVNLGASFDRGMTQFAAARTTRAVRATGIHWNFAPVRRHASVTCAGAARTSRSARTRCSPASSACAT